MTKLAIVGHDGIDIALYAALALNRIGEKTIVVDRSSDLRLMETVDIPVNLREKTATEYSDIHIFSEGSEHEDNDSVHIIYYYGTNTDSASINECDGIIFNTDMKTEHVKRIAKVDVPVAVSESKKEGKKTVEEKYIDKNVRLVITHFISARYGKEFILDLFEKPIKDKEVIILPYNEADYRLRLSIGNGRLRLGKLSADFRAFINDLLESFFKINVDKKLIKKIYVK
jgi:hypothetical protein